MLFLVRGLPLSFSVFLGSVLMFFCIASARRAPECQHRGPWQILCVERAAAVFMWTLVVSGLLGSPFCVLGVRLTARHVYCIGSRPVA